MALFDKNEATELRELFAAMDAADEADARAAMAGAAGLLRDHDYSFCHIIQEIDARGLLLPTKVGAAIRLMDSTMMSEAASAFSGARRLMKNCGLTFAGIIGALDREPLRTEHLQQLMLAYKREAQRSRELEAELQKLRANAAAVAAAMAATAGPPGPVGEAPVAASSPFRNLIVMAMLMLGVVVAASIISSFADLYRPANATTPPPPGGPAPAAATAVAGHGSNEFLPPRTGWNCWRNRGIQGPCF
jgi:hypothetical protein